MNQEAMIQEANTPSKGRSISYEELKTHHTYADAWISINGLVYDITHFIHRHPFGDTFRGHLGTECGGLFSSAHLNTNVDKLILNNAFLSKYNIAIIGCLDASGDRLRKGNDNPFLDRIIYKHTNNDEFWIELRTVVASFLKSSNEDTHYTFSEGMLYILYHLSIYALLSYLTWIEGSYCASVLFGFHMVCALANISHMATHHGFTRNKWLNFIAMSIYDLSGTSGLEWQIAHQTHHSQPHSSIDYQTNAYDSIGIRIHKYMACRKYHKYQPIYFWIVISSYLLFKLFATTVWLYVNMEFVQSFYEILGHVLARVILLGGISCCIYIHGFLVALILFTLYSIAYAQTAFILLFNNHEETHKILGENENVQHFYQKMSWAEVQVRTSGNWYPTNWLLSFIEFHYGYFNYHIEHHLFPTLKPRLLKKIAPLVKQVCIKHGVPYISTTFLEVQKSLRKHIFKLSILYK